MANVLQMLSDDWCIKKPPHECGGFNSDFFAIVLEVFCKSLDHGIDLCLGVVAAAFDLAAYTVNQVLPDLR